MSYYRGLSAVCLLILAPACFGFPADLFGYRQQPQLSITDFPQWVSVLARHLIDDTRDGDCTEQRFNRCHLEEWLQYLREIRQLPRRRQLDAVNRFANERKYVLDFDNYGLEDYWAIPRQFLGNGGDCEDYAITKLFSLSWLGYPVERMRIVVLQDTNLRVAHAVLALAEGSDILILDNQVQDVLSHRSIVHYAPVYSINANRWWLHTPND